MTERLVSTKVRRSRSRPILPCPPQPVPAPARPAVSISDSAGIGDVLIAVAIAAGLGGQTTVRVPRHRLEWAALFADVAIDGDLAIPFHEYNETPKDVPRWQWWADQLGTVARLPDPKPLPAEAVEWATPLAGRIVLAPFAAHPSRTWPLDRWLAVARQLADLGFDLIVLDDGPPQRTEAFQFGRTVRLLGERPARVAAAIATAAAFAGNDSGMAHVAGLLRVPAVAICSHASDNEIFGLYPTVRELGSRQFGNEEIDREQVVRAILERIGSTLGDFPTVDFLGILADRDRWRELYWLPIYAALWRTVQALVPGRIVEIGSRAGYSAWTMLHACPHATVQGFDLNADRDGGFVGACEHARAINPERFTLTIADSHALAALPPCDLVYIDGDHTEAGCCQDLELAAGSGARWLLVDDVANCPDVKRAADRFAAERGLAPRFVPSRTGLYVFDMAEAARPLAASDLLILSGATPDYDVGVLAQSNHELFAHLAGQKQEFRTDGFEPSRPPAWSKVRFLLEALRRSDSPVWVFWLDADAVFLRPGDLREFCDSAFDLVVGVDLNGLNTGAFFVRNCGWARAFLERVWAMGEREEFRTHAWWEQAAIQHLYLTDVDVRPHVKLVSHREFNSYPHWASHGYAEGDLVAHFCGFDPARKLACVADYVDRLTPGSWQIDERHRTWIREILRSGRFRRVLEVGCFRGYSTEAFLEAVAAGDVDELHLCDLVITPQLAELVARYDLGDRLKVHRGRSIEVLVGDTRFDLVFLDGGHRAETVNEEIKLLLAAGVRAIFAHDTAHLDGPRLVRPAFEAAGYQCLEDAVDRPGEGTGRGMLFAARDAADLAAGFATRPAL